MSNGEVGQYYYKVQKTSGLGNGASYSDTPDPSFYCQGIFSSLLVANLDRIRRRYEFPDGFSLVVSSGDAYVYQLRFVTLYEDALIAGLHPLAWDLLIFLNIDPGQLASNG